MSKLVFSLENDKSSTDIRANEFAYILTIKNTGTESVNLLSLQPRIPSDVTSFDVKNPTSEALKAKYERICKQLEFILNNNLQAFSKKIRKRLVENSREIMKEIFDAQGNSLFAFAKLMMKVLSGRSKNLVEQQFDRLNAYAEKIENYSQAEAAYKRWIEPTEEVDEKKIYQSKMMELQEIEGKIGSDIYASSLATIEPDSFFSQTYVFEFLRDKWEPRLYNIAIEGTYSIDGKEKKYVESASASLTVTPDPRRLTVLAILSSFLGAIVKHCMDVYDKSPGIPFIEVSSYDAFTHQSTKRFFLNWTIGAISALVFFNVYERTEIGKKIDVGVSWRSALLIGVVCGLLGDRIIGALKALIP